MRIDGLDLQGVLSGLKDFQRRTVDYVFQRMYLDDVPAHRFLVADEVGLGKTMVAKGLIARTLDHLRDKVDRIDIVYVCSNAAIAQQNINRLNVLGERHFAIATRLTLLPAQLHALSSNRVNFVSFTPGTTFDLGRRGGTWAERVLIHRMLCPRLSEVENGLTNLLQGGMSTDNWRRRLRESREPLDETLEQRFVERTEQQAELLNRLRDTCDVFRRQRTKWPREINRARLTLIGELRQLLAHVCVDALEPDLVILDEFQRFKDLLHGDSEAAELASSLMRYRSPEGDAVRVVLLSATPYKPLTTDDDSDDNHYRDFVQTIQFLVDSPEQISDLEEELRRYRTALFAGAESDASHIGAARDAVQSRLRSVMVRTERVGSTAQQDAMLTAPIVDAPVAGRDLHQARLIGRVADAVGAGDQTEYWKSAPYVMHFMKDYELRRRLNDALQPPPVGLIDAIADGEDVLLRRRHVGKYQKLDPSNGRLRALLEDTIEKGLWRRLWMPPSLPYVQAPEDSGPRNVTKALVFSSWNVVPDAIASLLSYEAERRMVATEGELPSYQTFTRKRRPLLRFALEGRTRETGMPTLALLYPCVTLAEAVDPLRIAAEAGGPVSLKELRDVAAHAIREALEKTGRWPGEGTTDPQWYWAALPLLDFKRHPVTQGWMQGHQEWRLAIADEEDAGDVLQRHIARFAGTAADESALGAGPEDLVDVLVDLALGSPAIAALRSLGRVVPGTPLAATANLQAAALVAAGFRTMYNLPETIALLRGEDEGAYWRLVAQHGVDHDVQAVLDEYVHILRESLGLLNMPPAEVVGGIAEEMAAALSLRTSRVDADEIQARRGGSRVRLRRFGFRCRFALRFTELKDDNGATLARAGSVRQAFNSPFRPFVLVSTSIGQEGLDFHQYCHAVYHWNLPTNPVDIEQREGRVHRYKGHAVRKNVAQRWGLNAASTGNGSNSGGARVVRMDSWNQLFERAVRGRDAGESDLVPFWIYPIEGGASIERRVPILPFSREERRFKQLQRRLAVYRLVFGQPRQEDLMAYLVEHALAPGSNHDEWRISLEPPAVSLDEYDRSRAAALREAPVDIVLQEPAEEAVVAAAARGEKVQWTSAAFHDVLIQNYMQGLLTADEYGAVEKVLDFSLAQSGDVGWMQNEVGAFSPVFPPLASRGVFALNTRGEMTLLFGQLKASSVETRFAEEWRAELEEIFGNPRWPAYYPILKAGTWAPEVDDLIDTIAWRLDVAVPRA